MWRSDLGVGRGSGRTATAGVLVVAAILGACRRTDVSAHTAPRIARDTSLLAAVMLAVRDAAAARHQLPVKFDPRALWPDTSTRDWGDGRFAALAKADLDARRAEVERLGIAPGSGAIPNGCPSVMMPVDPSVDRSGCPRDLSLIVTLSLPRQTSSSTGDRTETVRSVQLVVHSLGWSIEVYDYVMRKQSAGWFLEKRVIVGVRE